MSYGVNEVLLSSVLGAVVFAVFSAQPLVIVGVTGRFLRGGGRVKQRADEHRSHYRLQLVCPSSLHDVDRD